MYIRVELCVCILLWVHFFFLICSYSFYKFKNSICEHTFYNLCRERPCEGPRRVWFPCAVIPHGNLLKPCEVKLSNKTVSSIISIFRELLGFDDLIGFKSDVEKECHDIDESRLWYGSRIGFKDNGIWREDSPHDCYHVWEARVCWVIYWKPVALMLTRLVVWMSFCTSFCCWCGLWYFNWGY